MKMGALGRLLGIALLLVPFQVYSQEAPHFSPYQVKAQFAGHLGFVSVGAGRTFFEERLETDLFLGYLPEKIGGDRIVTAALKITYLPLRTLEVKSLDWQPLRTGLQLSHTFGKDYYIFGHNDKYPKGYYGFPTALHLYFYAGGQANFARVGGLGRFGAYYEFGSNVEYLVSYLQNPKYLGPGKIFHLALGLRMKL